MALTPSISVSTEGVRADSGVRLYRDHPSEVRKQTGINVKSDTRRPYLVSLSRIFHVITAQLVRYKVRVLQHLVSQTPSG